MRFLVLFAPARCGAPGSAPRALKLSHRRVFWLCRAFWLLRPASPRWGCFLARGWENGTPRGSAPPSPRLAFLGKLAEESGAAASAPPFMALTRPRPRQARATPPRRKTLAALALRSKFLPPAPQGEREFRIVQLRVLRPSKKEKELSKENSFRLRHRARSSPSREVGMDWQTGVSQGGALDYASTRSYIVAHPTTVCQALFVGFLPKCRFFRTARPRPAITKPLSGYKINFVVWLASVRRESNKKCDFV